jgi:DNA-binding CsgD family transcriptional regulator
MHPQPGGSPMNSTSTATAPTRLPQMQGPAAPAVARGLYGRKRECEVLARLVANVRAGESSVLVLRGEAGVGKTALLGSLSECASGCRVVRGKGVESEMELAYAGLQQLCAPVLDHLCRLPGPQRGALTTAFGLSPGDPPDRFMVGLAVLALLADVAEEQALVCVIDDAQWLDRVSAHTLSFVARNLLVERVALVFALREPSVERELTGLPHLAVTGLSDGEAGALLDSVISVPVDKRVRDRIIAEARGNPLALLELPRRLTPAELAFGCGPSEMMQPVGSIEQGFLGLLELLPAATRRVLLVAAAEPLGDRALLRRAVDRLGIGPEAAVAAAATGLIELGPQIRFRHPLARSAAYRSASLEERREVHLALAEVSDPEIDPDRRAWHRSHAAVGPDEAVASELERSAGRAQARGGFAAAATFLEGAARLTLDPVRRVERALAAAQANHDAGASEAALALLAAAQPELSGELHRARADLLRAEIAFASRRGNDAPPLLLEAGRQLEPLDVGLAREAYLEAFAAAVIVGRLSRGGDVVEVAKAVRATPTTSTSPRPHDLLLDGLALLVTEGRAAATPLLKQAVKAFRGDAASTEEQLRWLWLAGRVAQDLWDDESWEVLCTQHVGLARHVGALTLLPLALRSRIFVHGLWGELAEGEALVGEVQSVAAATGTQLAPYGVALLAALRGRQAEAADLITATLNDVVSRGEGDGLAVSHYTAALLYNGLGHYAEALAAAEVACEDDDLGVVSLGLAELVEAAARSDRREIATVALQRLSETTRAAGTDWALGIEARCRALVSADGVAEPFYREAIDRLGRTRVRLELARAHLLYGEWLRRGRRRVDAREQLRTSRELLTTLGVEAFAERARRELLATGETARRRTIETRDELTAQETQVAWLARGGLSNPEIGAELFISPRTVKYHLRKVFTKLDITSRQDLRVALHGEASAAILG